MTVMFCDLVDSTKLSDQLDPEDLRELLRDFRETARSIVVRHGGFVASHMGDGLLVLFAYPRAHEDDPHRAVRAGLDIIEAIGRLAPHPEGSLRARVGIATGLVVIGPLLGTEISFDEVVVGRTVNLAARLQATAQPNCVIVSETTKRLVHRAFECVSLGAELLKGFDQRVPIWQVAGEVAEHDRPHALSWSSQTLPLVGRLDELKLLSERWREARDAHGSLVIVQGEPGVGKSRLIEALRDVAVADSAVILRYSCAPRFQNSALYPVIRQVERALGILPDDTPGQKLDKIDMFVATETLTNANMAFILAELLSVPNQGRHESLDSPEKLKQRMFGCLKDWLFSTAGQKPKLVILEDMHWADPTTLELLDDVLNGIEERRMMAVASLRPGFPLSLTAKSTLLDVGRLTDAQSRQIVSRICNDSPPAPAVVDHILRQSEGVPLFIEEITKAVLESATSEHVPTSRGPAGTPSQGIPSTLQDSLEARLDRLSPVKIVAQVAAAIGREFSYNLIASVLDVPKDELTTALNALMEADLIYQQSVQPETYSFKHALLQDAAYGMMLRSTRQRLHQRIAVALGDVEKAVAGAEPAIIAHHWVEAGAPALAIPHLELAAQRASSRAAHTEARRHYLRALELVASEPVGGPRDESEFRLSVGLGLATSAARGYAAPEVQATYQRALDVSRRLGDNVELFPALRGLCTFYIVRAGLATALELGSECLRLAEVSHRPADLIESWTALGYTSVYLGALAEGRAFLTRAVALYRQAEGESLTYPSLQDPAVACLSLEALVAWALGEVGTAERLQSEALELAERLGRPFNRAYALSFAAFLDNVRHRSAEASAHASAALQIADEHGFAIWSGAATLQGAIATAAVDVASAIPVLTRVLEAWQAGGAELSLPYFLWSLARSQRRVGDAAAALCSVERALEVAKRTGESFLSSEFHRLRGELRHGRSSEADQSWRDDFIAAISMARRQGAPMLELRALKSYCERVPASVLHSERDRLSELSSALPFDHDDPLGTR